MNNSMYDIIADELADILGRDPTQAEVQDYIDQLEARSEDNAIDAYMEGHYNTD